MARIGMALALVVGLTSPAMAQGGLPERPIFLAIDGGFQPGSGDLVDEVTFNLFGEEGTSTTTYDIDRSGAVFRANAGVLLMRGFGVAVGFTRSTSTGTAQVEVTAPHPLFFNRPRLTTLSLDALGHREQMVHFQGVWRVELADTIDMTVSGGPTLISLDQAVITSTPLGAEIPPFNVVGVRAVQMEDNESGVGFNVGVDFTYLLTPNYGVGVLMQYAGGSVDIPFRSAEMSVDVGGFRFAGGLRARF